jgi:hypothetical protein
MKNIFSITFIYIAFTLNGLCQQIPDDIQATLDKLKAETRISLNDTRTNRQSRGFHVGLIQWVLPDEQFKKAEKLNLKLDLGMIYDNDMRNRLLQLLKNEYRLDELDTLVNRLVFMSIEGYKRKILEISKLDTMALFKKTVDSIYSKDVKTNPQKLLYPYQYDNKASTILKLDTLTIFRNKLDSLLKKARKEAAFSYMHDDYSDLSSIAELCGYVNDKRFVQPLIEALNKPNNFRKEVVIKALARMKIEPYHTNLLKENTHSISEVLSGISIDYALFSDVLRSQESFLELSKYLKSDITCLNVVDEDVRRRHGDELKFCILRVIYDNLENADMKASVGNGADKINVPYDITHEWDAAIVTLYNWMQKNYGKYQITWYHY